MEFPKQEYWSGLPFHSPGDLPDPGVELTCQFFTTKPRGKPVIWDKSEVKVAQSCLTLCDPMDCIVHGILQAGIMEWVALSFSRGSSQPRDWTQISRTAGRFWTGYPIPSPGGLPDPGIEPGSPALQADSLPAELSGKPFIHLFKCAVWSWFWYLRNHYICLLKLLC